VKSEIEGYLFREYILEIFENHEISMIHLMKYCEIEFVTYVVSFINPTELIHIFPKGESYPHICR